MAAAALLVVLLAAIPLHWIKSEVTDIRPDDVQLMDPSGPLWAGQGPHWLPLYRLARLPFDRHFPEWYRGFHALAVAAHLASAWLLYVLGRRNLSSPWGAVVTALLFAWSTVGDEALVWKAGTPFALSWPLALAAAWCLGRSGPAWTASGTVALAAAVGLFSGTLLAIPGICLAARRRQAVWPCAAVGLGGAAAWLAVVWPQLDFTHYWAFGGATAPALRLPWALWDTLRAYEYQLFLGFRLPFLVVPLALLLLWLRREVNWRWILAALALTAPLLFVTLLVRRQPEVWKISRYLYQSYTFWCVGLGAVLDSLIRRWGPRPLLALPVLALGYLALQVTAAQYERDYLLSRPYHRRGFWLGWDRFFEFARPGRLPELELAPGVKLSQAYRLCRPGAEAASGSEEELRQELERARAAGLQVDTSTLRFR